MLTRVIDHFVDLTKCFIIMWFTHLLVPEFLYKTYAILCVVGFISYIVYLLCTPYYKPVDILINYGNGHGGQESITLKCSEADITDIFTELGKIMAQRP